MSTKVFFGMALVFLLCFSVQAEEQWEQLRGEHFIVYFSKAHEAFAHNVSRAAECYYTSVADSLKYVRYSNFWKWDNRVKIYLYSDHPAYLAATGQRAWSHGMADYARREIVSYVWNEEFIDTLLPHEIAHLVFRDFVGFKGDVPLWLDEGVAQWAERGGKTQRIRAVKALAAQEKLLPVQVLMSLDVRGLDSDDEVLISSGDEDPGSQKKVRCRAGDVVAIYYLQAFSLVGFLIEGYGAEGFVAFSRQLRDGKSVTDALRFAYPAQFHSLEVLEQRWKENLRKNN